MSTHDNPTTPADQAPLLQITDLEVAFRSSTGLVSAVRGANLTLYPGQSVAVVGESGSGKSTLAAAVIGLLPGTGRVTGGTIRFDGEDITRASSKRYRELRGSSIGLVPQDPMTNLNPVWSIGFQVKEALRANGLAGVADDRLAAIAAAEKGEDLSPSERIGVDEQVALLLEDAGLPDAARRARRTRAISRARPARRAHHPPPASSSGSSGVRGLARSKRSITAPIWAL